LKHEVIRDPPYYCMCLSVVLLPIRYNKTVMMTFSQEESRGKHVIGIDEVGRGALAGPICACACILETNLSFHKNFTIRDSKTMTPRQREKTAAWLQKNSMSFIAECDAQTIDEIGISEANKFVLKTVAEAAIQHVNDPETKVFVDYFTLSGIATISVPKAERIHISVASASILAKVYRDSHMKELAQGYPHYGWYTNMGYGTASHREAIKIFGLSPKHRRTFTSSFVKQP